MTTAADNRLIRARELAKAARDEFARAEDARGREAVIGLQNACGKGWLAALEAAHAYFLSLGIPEAELPGTDRGWRFFVGRHMEQSMKKEFNDMRLTFHVDGYYGGIVDFDDMPRHLDELDEFIETVSR
jgi:hypothetical protein